MIKWKDGKGKGEERRKVGRRIKKASYKHDGSDFLSLYFFGKKKLLRPACAMGWVENKNKRLGVLFLSSLLFFPPSVRHSPIMEEFQGQKTWWQVYFSVTFQWSQSRKAWIYWLNGWLSILLCIWCSTKFRPNHVRCHATLPQCGFPFFPRHKWMLKPLPNPFFPKYSCHLPYGGASRHTP